MLVMNRKLDATHALVKAGTVTPCLLLSVEWSI